MRNLLIQNFVETDKFDILECANQVVDYLLRKYYKKNY